MHKITVKDFSQLELGDKRRNERFVTIINNAIAQPGSSIPKQNKGWYDTKATYEFFKNETITLANLQQAISGYGKEHILKQAPKVILMAHDTSNISYNQSSAEGLGYLDNKEGTGILLHNSIAVSTGGIPQGLLHQQLWTRHENELGKGQERKNRPFEDKESYKWFKGIEAVNELLGPSIKKIHIADREADIYDLFFTEPQDNSELLIRACHPRKTSNSNDIWEEIGATEIAAVISLTVPVARGKTKKHTIKAEVRYREVEILQPRSGEHRFESVRLTAIEVKQQNVKKGEEGICWQLLTTIEISTIDEVNECILWYTYRWLIERFHYTLKSGLGIEALQLQQAESLKKAIVIYSLAAFKIMQLTYQSRETPEASCEVVLTKEEWQALYILIHKSNQLPKFAPSLVQTALWIGRLGGHLGRKSDGPPGLKTMWLGYQRLRDYAQMYSLINSNGKTGSKNLGKG